MRNKLARKVQKIFDETEIKFSDENVQMLIDYRNSHNSAEGTSAWFQYKLFLSDAIRYYYACECCKPTLEGHETYLTITVEECFKMILDTYFYNLLDEQRALQRKR